MTTIDIHSVEERLSDNTSVDYSVNERRMKITRDSAKKLQDAGIINSLDGLKITVEVFTVAGDTVCEIDYMVFEDIGYIHWTSVPEEFQNKGIATVVRESVVEDLFTSRNVDVIYSYPVSEVGRMLAENNGFNPTDDVNGLAQWLKLAR